jgi:hypothetical protein
LNIQKELHFREYVRTFIQAKETSNERKYIKKYRRNTYKKYKKFSPWSLTVYMEISMWKASMTR